MTQTLQQILVTAAVLAAFAWLLVDRIRRHRSKSKCDTCALAETVRRPPTPRPR